MNLILNANKADYINQKGQELLCLLERITSDPVKSTENKNAAEGYLSKKEFIDLSDSQIGPGFELEIDVNEKIVEKYRVSGLTKIGLGKKGFSNLYKLVDNILKEKDFKALVSEKFLVDSIFEWVLIVYDENSESFLSDHLIQNCNDEIQFFNVFVPILYLESNLSFIIGITSFSYIEDEYINQLASRINEKERENYISSLLKYKGQLYGVCCIKAERNKAIEIGLGQITFSVDILRLLSPTTEAPEYKCFYDVDFRNVHQLTSHVLVQPISNLKGFGLDVKVKPQPFVIEQSTWEIMNQLGLKNAHDFIVKTFGEKTELERLIYNAVGAFSKAISTIDLHERIVQLFTVLESLLLNDDNSPIIDCVCKYLPKMVSKNIEERKNIIKTVKVMYKVRSSMVHHAQKKDFEISDLATIQICTRELILNLISLSKVKKEKTEILKEIDDLILSA